MEVVATVSKHKIVGYPTNNYKKLLFSFLCLKQSDLEYMKNPTYRYLAIEMVGTLFTATNFILFLNQFEVGVSIGVFSLEILGKR